MKCGISKNLHHVDRFGHLSCYSPMYHKDDFCPFEIHDCKSYCGSKRAFERECIIAANNEILDKNLGIE